MELGTLGPQAVTDEDINYRGGRFSEVRDAIFANPYQRVWGSQGEPPLPVYKVTLSSVLAGLLPFGKSYQFLDAAKRTVDSHADLRWGTDGKGYRRLLHPNGVCLIGQWGITEESPYSGYFKRGSKGLVIGRYSTCCTETRRGHNRSLSLMGKIYPTLDPEHAEPLRPASFIAQEDLGGEKTYFINDAEVRNAPDTRGWRRGMGMPILLTTGLFSFAPIQNPQFASSTRSLSLRKARGNLPFVQNSCAFSSRLSSLGSLGRRSTFVTKSWHRSMMVLRSRWSLSQSLFVLRKDSNFWGILNVISPLLSVLMRR